MTVCAVSRKRHWLTCCSSTCTALRRKSERLWTRLLKKWGWRKSCLSSTPHGQVELAATLVYPCCSILGLSGSYRMCPHCPGMRFQYEPHHRTQVPLLRTDEELIETLEDNQVQLQNLMSSKYIAHFLDEVSTWQSKLSVADSVISIWFEVQRTWTHLESIFIGSEDIRSQLPEVRR